MLRFPPLHLLAKLIGVLIAVLIAGLLTGAPAPADVRAAPGRLLVATDKVHGEIFARTVILLLHYDESGAMGLVVNRPTDVLPAEVLEDPARLSGYRGTFFWGGPVEMAALWALFRSPSPPAGATTIIDNVHLVSFDEAAGHLPADATNLRLYIGYAGWAPGQLDDELASGSWDVQDGSDDVVFAEDPRGVWEALEPAREFRAGIEVEGYAPAGHGG